VTIVEFLQARLADDEHEAREIAVVSLASFPFGEEKPYAARAVREVEAKRAILADHETRVERGFDPVDAIDWSCSVCSRCGTISSDESDGCPTVLALATVYADHPDYDPVWSQALTV
jgi:hypothetical protein